MELIDKTPKDIFYCASPYGYISTIPAGTTLTPATNLPEGGYWVDDWEGMTDQEKSWGHNYGFHLTNEELTE